MRLPSRTTTAFVAIAALSAVAISGCSDDEPGDTTTTTPSAPATTDDMSADEAEVAAVYAEYWQAVITSENNPSEDRSIFEGVATGSAVETQMARVQSLIRDGIHMIGEPVISEPEVTVDGDSARVEACLDTSGWGAAVGDVTAPPNPTEPRPTAVVVTRIDGQWLVSEQLPNEEAQISC